MPSINLSEEEIHLLTGTLEVQLEGAGSILGDYTPKVIAQLQKRIEQLIDMPDESDDLIEALAAQAHEAWSGWMAHLFSKCDVKWLDDGATETYYVIPQWAKTRWERQMNTDYADLPEDEKKSDRVEARKYLTCVVRADALFDDAKEQESQL